MGRKRSPGGHRSLPQRLPKLFQCARIVYNRVPLAANDSEYRWLLDSGTPRFASDGAFLGYIGSCMTLLSGRRRKRRRAAVGSRSYFSAGSVCLADDCFSRARKTRTACGDPEQPTAAMQYLERGKLSPEQLQEILTDVVGAVAAPMTSCIMCGCD